MSVFLDTNVIAYQYDDDTPEKQERAREIFLQRAGDAVVSTQVMIELHAVLTSKLGHGREAAARVLGMLDLEVVPADAGLVQRAAKTSVAHDLSIFDAMILEAAVSGGCEELWTEDLADGAILRGVRIHNPFRTA